MKRPFFLYWYSSTSLSLADVMYIMVLTTFLYEQTGSALQAAILPLVNALTSFVAGMTISVIRRFASFRQLLLLLQIVKASAITIFTFGFSYFSSQYSYLLFILLIVSLAEGWGNPLLRTTIIHLVPQPSLLKANSLLSLSSQTVQIAGYSLTGFLVIAMGNTIPLLITVALLWSGVLTLFFTLPHIPETTTEKASPVTTMKAGWVTLWRQPTLRLVTLMDVIEGMAGTIWIGALTLVYVTEALHESPQWWGYINGSYYIGTIVGGFLTLALASFVKRHLVLAMIVGSACFSLLTLLYGLSTMPLLSLVLCVLMGPSYQLRDVSQETAFQSSVHAEQLPNVYGARSVLLSLTSASSIPLFGFIADHYGIRSVYVIASIFISFSALLAFMLLQKQRSLSTVNNL
ncbi:hypothetical protein A374_06061 [Fictibacillus macauensis ZFHKF-1]|uniref:Major facilitator superfamily (MFS) profile domain-containing protein n=1 Tax=Fictibacillus macauensis ZFHKF-1 TaxID=1196324 RepID=I8UGW1_9BACL|nr:MFS transporter [Fictibacillus macauensis]EIT86140.1 hypothetical protein A374_06061 [Fictibacillus macauensis ZFHKF-1]